ncbi:hypothetical protein QBC32DRAFT_240837 [Pseudoneurospora amorphoporcata]|uniref:Letm1 RBD domain-containing protein n=1 Tax=Pseudoneurospora amorphoporcata TaxID=241081 RepID=A0AAN6SEL0_9PEZI|nr:hypothetical protein QBC32DRAFT_240837 [Pseudoneurospora amorphoporcata]
MISRIPLSARNACRHAYSAPSRLRSTTGLLAFAQLQQPSISQLSLSARSFSSTTRNSFKPTFPRHDEPSQNDILEQQARHGVNPPYTTRPPPLNLPERQPDASTFSHLFATGKAYVTFYKTGLRQVVTNFKLLRAVGKGGEGPIARSENPITDADCIDGYLRFRTRGSLLLYKRMKHDLNKLPVFALLLLVCGEFTPFVVLAVPTIVPYTCRIPKQVDKILKRIEEKRAAALDELVGEVYEEDDYHLVDPKHQLKEEVEVTEVTAEDLAAWKAKAQEMTEEEKEEYEFEIRQCEEIIKDQRERRGETGKEVDPRPIREQAQEWVDLARADREKRGGYRIEIDVFPMTASEALEQLDPLSADCEQFNMLDALARTYDVSSWWGPAGRERAVHKHMRFLAVDTELLEKDGGVEALEDEEVVLACIDRGIDVRGRKQEDLRYVLEKWVILTHVLATDREDCLRRMAVLGTCPEILWPGIPWPEESGEVPAREESVEAEEKEKE